jgi:hypothetical protein
MKKAILVCALLGAAAVARAQDPAAASPYEGTSAPPPDNTILTSTTPAPKPLAGRLATPSETATQPAPQPAPVTAQTTQPSSVDPAQNYPDPDGNLVEVQPRSAARPQTLTARKEAYDPDGDIVHPHPLGPNELGEGTTMRIRMMTRLSSATAERGENFRGRVATDVLRDGQVMIPAGAEIEGRVVLASRGHMGGTGELRLKPETLILADGTRYRFSAQVTGTPATKNRVENEGVIRPGSRMGRDAIELGGGTVAGVTAGALIGGPGGALAGGAIGLGVMTAHLLISHPQAVVENGDVLMITLNERLNLVPAGANGQ